MIKKLTITTMLTGMFFFTGCGGGLSESSNSATMKIKNTTQHKVFQLYVRDSGAYSWGIDMLPSDKYISANSTVAFETLSCDKKIDIKATGFLGDPVWLFENVKISCGLSKEILLSY